MSGIWICHDRIDDAALDRPITIKWVSPTPVQLHPPTHTVILLQEAA